jgi:exosortase
MNACPSPGCLPDARGGLAWEILASCGGIRQNTRMNAPPATPAPASSRRTIYILCGTIALTLIGFFGFLEKYGQTNTASTIQWLIESWNHENKSYEHGWLVAIVMCFFIFKAWEPISKEPHKGSLAGLGWVALGIFFWLGAYRTIQARAAVLALPCFIMGGAQYVLGWKAARHLIFPLFMFVFMIPAPGIDQMTNGMAVTSTKIASGLGSLIGIETVASGTQLVEINNAGGQLQVDDGCSGIRSFMALMLISYAYAFVVHKKWSERLVIWALTLPIAIVANGVRITSILIMAQVNRKFATGLWHDYSGFFSFAAALALLMLLSFIMRKGLKALRPKVTVTRVGTEQTTPSTP